MNLPTTKEIESLHLKYAPSEAAFALVFTHCEIVRDIAMQLIRDHNLIVNKNLVQVGCLLHDIGVYPLLNKDGTERTDLHYITHGIRGEEILRSEGFPELISDFASHHTGVGLTKYDIQNQNLPLPQMGYVARSIEERLIMYADKFHSKDTPPCFNSYEQYKTYVSRFGNDKAKKFEQLAQEFGIPDLAPLSTKYQHQIR